VPCRRVDSALLSPRRGKAVIAANLGGRTLAAIAWSGCIVACSSSSDHSAPHYQDIGRKVSSGTTMGFVLADFDPLMYHTKDRKWEWPEGVIQGNRVNWEAQFPTLALRRRQLERCGSLLNRGPNCENVWLNPQVMKDPLPWREIKGTVSYGENLDGTPDGR